VTGLTRLARRVQQQARHRLARRAVDACGSHTILECRIVRDEPGSRIEVGSYSHVRGILGTHLRTSRLTIGDNTFINARTLIESFESIEIGNDVLMGFEAILADGRSHSTSWHERVDDQLLRRRTGRINVDALVAEPIVVEDGVWIGARAMVFRGVTLGEGCTVGAGAVVTKSVPPFTVVAGNPAIVVGEVPAIRGVRTIY
jgi:acetyltransferase-like isoleucine patch superfamily enzyme